MRSEGLFIILILLINPPYLHSSDEIVFGYPEMRPFYFTNENNQPEGFIIDIVDNVMKETGYKWTARPYPAKRLFKHLETGGVDLWVGISSFAPKGKTLVGSIPVTKIELRAYTKGKTAEILKKEDLKYRSVVVFAGYSYGGWINFIKDKKNKIRYLEAYNRVEGFRLLEKGIYKYLLDYKRPSVKALKKLKIEDINYNTISSIDCYFVVSKKTINAENILNNIEKAFVTLEEKKLTE